MTLARAHNRDTVPLIIGLDYLLKRGQKKTIVLNQRGASLGPNYIWPMSCESNFNGISLKKNIRLHRSFNTLTC